MRFIRVLKFCWPGAGFFPYEIGLHVGVAHWTGWLGFLGLTISYIAWAMADSLEERYGLRRGRH